MFTNTKSLVKNDVFKNFTKYLIKWKKKVTKSMTVKKNVNLDLKEGICTEKSFCLTFYIVQNNFSVYIESLFKGAQA